MYLYSFLCNENLSTYISIFLAFLTLLSSIYFAIITFIFNKKNNEYLKRKHWFEKTINIEKISNVFDQVLTIVRNSKSKKTADYVLELRRKINSELPNLANSIRLIKIFDEKEHDKIFKIINDDFDIILSKIGTNNDEKIQELITDCKDKVIKELYYFDLNAEFIKKNN